MSEEAASYTYNENGDLTGVTATDSEQQSYSYSGADLISQTTMGNGNYTYGYDTKHNVTSVANDGVNMAMTYDTAGNVLSSVLTGSGTTAKITSSATYTNSNNLLATSTDSRGNATTYAYNSAIYKQLNIPTAVTDARGIKQVTSLNTTNGRTTMNYISGTASVDYTYSGSVLTTINRGGYLPGNTSTKYTQTYTMGYNAFDQLTSVKVGTTVLADYTYAGNNGLLSSITYGNDDVVSYTYDELERISSVVYDDGTTITYTYNGLGALGKLTDSRGRTYLYNYDSLGRLISMSEYKGSYIVQNMSTEYDTSNRVSTLTYKVDPNLGGTLEADRSYGYTYDDTDGTLTKLTGPGGRLAYAYDGLKRLQYKNTYNAESDGSVTVGRQYGYLAGSGTNVSTTLVGSLILKNGSSIYSSATYDYDEVGNITSITNSYLGNRSYTYDTLGQMTKEVIGNTTYNYTYDTYGNIRSKTTTSGTTANFTYGTSGWLDKLLSYNGNSISYDAIGNPTVWHDGSAFTWSNGKQLTAATAADGTVLSYSYDADDLRLTKVVDGVTHNYIWQGDRLVSEQYSTTELEFFYDESGVPYAFDYNGTIYYYITNLQGDVIGIVDASGVSKATYKYNAWGEDIDTTGVVSDIETINPLRYRGYYYDSETKLYYLQSRYYDPVVCRFINADEANNLAANGDYASYNLYAYCGNNPAARKDGGGEVWHLLTGAAVGIMTQYVCDVAQNLFEGDSFSEALKPRSSWADYGSAALSGVLATSGVGLGAAIAANAALGGATYLANCAIEGADANIVDFGIATGIGALSGVIGGSGVNGARLRGVWKTSNNILKTSVSPKKITMYILKKVDVVSQIAEGTARTVTAGIASNEFNNKRKLCTNSVV